MFQGSQATREHDLGGVSGGVDAVGSLLAEWQQRSSNWDLLRKSMDQYRPSLIPKKSCTHPILSLRDSEAFCRCVRPRPARLPETMKRCTCTTLNQISPRSTPPSIRRSAYVLLTTLPFHHPAAVTRAPARTCTHNDLRACVPPVSGRKCRS